MEIRELFREWCLSFHPQLWDSAMSKKNNSTGQVMNSLDKSRETPIYLSL